VTDIGRARGPHRGEHRDGRAFGSGMSKVRSLNSRVCFTTKAPRHQVNMNPGVLAPWW
jgi:hypothetical protein